MFAKISKIAAIASLVACVAAKPVPVHQELGMSLLNYQPISMLIFTVAIAARGYSFDNWGGLSSFSGFDNFYGSDNFVGDFSTSETTVTAETSELVCHSESVVIIQQRLLVLQEMAKRCVHISTDQSESINV